MSSTSMTGDFVVVLHLIANGKLRLGTPAPPPLTGSAAAYATQRGGSGRCTISAPKATMRFGTPLSSTDETPAEAEAEAESFPMLTVY